MAEEQNDAQKEVTMDAAGLRMKELDPALENLEETLGVNLVGFWDAYQKSDKKDETWTEGFLKALAAGIIAAYLIGRGGTDEELSQEEIDRLQEYIEEQSQYLDGFGSAAGGLTPAMGAARAGMYAAALTLPFWWGRTRYLELPAYPGDGSTTCLSRCKCHWEIVPLDEDAGDYDCTWVLGLAEHCSDCVDRSMAWRPLQVRGWNYSTSQKEILETVAFKHLSGQHNQKKHGYRGTKVSQASRSGDINSIRNLQSIPRNTVEFSRKADAIAEKHGIDLENDLGRVYGEDMPFILEALARMPRLSEVGSPASVVLWESFTRSDMKMNLANMAREDGEDANAYQNAAGIGRFNGDSYEINVHTVRDNEFYSGLSLPDVMSGKGGTLTAVAAHEYAHALDLYDKFSGTSTWFDAVKATKYAPSMYARMNNKEHFAESMALMAIRPAYFRKRYPKLFDAIVELTGWNPASQKEYTGISYPEMPARKFVTSKSGYHLQLLETAALKHLQGQHNQKKHGNRGAAKVSQQSENTTDLVQRATITHSAKGDSDDAPVWQIKHVKLSDDGELPENEFRVDTPILVVFRGPHKGEAFASWGVAMHEDMKNALAKVDESYDDAPSGQTSMWDTVRFRIDNDFSKEGIERYLTIWGAPPVKPGRESEVNGVDNIYSAIKVLRNLGFPKDMRVRINDYNGDPMDVTIKEIALKHLSGQHNQKKHGYRGAAKVSQFAKRDIEKEPPTMPAQLSRGTTGQAQQRMRERVAIMEKTYPGVKFSTAPANQEAVKRNSHLPGIGVPRAILDQKATPIDDPELHARLRLAYEQVTRESAGGRMPAATYTMIKFASGLTFQQVFGIINSMRTSNPKSVSLSVDRSGASVVFGLRDANGMPI